MRSPIGVAGVVAALSVTSDLTRGQSPGEAMRACLLGTELARRAGLDAVRPSDAYYTCLLRFAGCAATSHEIAVALGSDDIVVRARGDMIDRTWCPTRRCTAAATPSSPLLAESMTLTGGTLRAMPLSVLTDGDGRVAVVTGVSGTDGRAFDDRQILLFTIERGRVRSVDQFVGDPKAVAAFWE